MSLLLRERYVAVLAPAGAGLMRRRGRGRADALGWTTCGAAGQRPRGCDAPESPAWAAPVDALQRLLGELAPPRGRVTVVLSSHFARFRLIPWRDEIGSPAELDAYARIAYEDVYGAAVAGWTLRIAPEPAGRPRLAAAIEQALLDCLDALAHRSQLRLASVQPHLVAAFNRLRPRLPRHDFLLAVAEPGRCSLLLARQGAWAGVRSSATSISDEDIAAMLERECELAALRPDGLPPVFVHVAGRGRQAFPPVLDAVPEPLALASVGTASQAWCEMALAEA